MQSVGVAGGCSSLICLTLQLVVVLVTTRSEFYQYHAYGQEALWTISDYKQVIK